MYNLKLLVERLEGVSVLYVEDDPVQRKINEETFSKLFSGIDTAEDGVQGIEKFKSYFEEKDTFYDLVITDISMPNLDGIGMVEVLTELNPEQSIAVLSAHNELDQLRMLMDLGIDGYLSKPIEMIPLCHVLEKISGRIFIRKKNEQYLREIERLNKKLMKRNKELESQLVEDDDAFVSVEMKFDTIQEGHVENTADIREMLIDDIPDLQDIYDDLDNVILVCIEKRSYSTHYNKIASSLTRFASILSCYNLLTPLARKIEELALLLKEGHPPENGLDEIFNIVESFINSLGNWLRVWEENKVEDISYFNDSMITDINFIINLWKEVEVEGEMEFF